MDNLWQLQDAKSKFSELVNRVLTQGTQIVTRHGKKTVVIMPYDQYEKLLHPQDSLTKFLLSSPLAGTDLNLDRDKSLPRESDIEP